MISSRDNPKNHPIHVVDTNLGSAIFYNDLYAEETEKEVIKIHKKKEIINIYK